MPAEVNCRRCDVVFTAKRMDAMFCSECRKERAKERAEKYDTAHRDPCPNCGKPMVRRAELCKTCSNKARKGKYLGANNPNWHKGRTVDSAGYVMLRVTSEAKGTKAYRREHHIVWEEANDTPLPKNWIIHHLNGDKADNRIENLAAMSRRDHHVRHAEPYEKRIRDLEEQLS